MDLNYHSSTLCLFNNGEIIIKDQIENKNYIIENKKYLNILIEIKDLNYLAICNFDNVIKIFDMNLMIMKSKLIGHKKIINDIKYLIPPKNANYKYKIFSCSDDLTVKLWDLVQFKCFLTISLECSGILCNINFLHDKELIVLTNENKINIIE